MIELDVIAYLKNDDTLDTLLGSSAGDSKIYPVQMPQGATEPFIVYTTNAIGSVEENLKEISMSFNCIDSSYVTAKSIRDRVSFLLDQQDQIQSLITSTSYYVYWAKQVGGSVFKVPELDLFHNAIIFDFKYNELSRRYIDVINKTLTIPVFGSFVDEKIMIKSFYFQGGVTVKKIGIHLDTAPTGADITVDILKDDVEQGRIATLAAGSRAQTTDITDINFSTTEKFELIAKTVGSLEPGEGGIIMVHFQ